MCRKPVIHNNDVKWPTRRLNSPASRMFVHQFVQANIRGNMKAPYHYLCEGKLPVTNGFASQRASNAESVPILWRHHVSLDTMSAVSCCLDAGHLHVWPHWWAIGVCPCLLSVFDKIECVIVILNCTVTDNWMYYSGILLHYHSTDGTKPLPEQILSHRKYKDYVYGRC